MDRLRAFLSSSTDALSEREFRLLWIGQTGSFFGDALVGVALAFAVLGITGSPGDLGLVLAALDSSMTRPESSRSHQAERAGLERAEPGRRQPLL